MEPYTTYNVVSGTAAFYHFVLGFSATYMRDSDCICSHEHIPTISSEDSIFGPDCDLSHIHIQGVRLLLQ
jgi:hypothetical protein